MKDSVIFHYSSQQCSGLASNGQICRVLGYLNDALFERYKYELDICRGTLPYMAPELVHDPDHVSESADIWR